MKPFVPTSPARFFTLAGLLLASGLSGAQAQQTILFLTGDDHAVPITITPATSPTTLAIASGSATQSGAIGESGVAGALKIRGPGTIRLTADNTYTGKTSINNGGMVIDGGSIYDTGANSGSQLLVGDDSNTTATAIVQNGGSVGGGSAASDIEIGYGFQTTGSMTVTGPGSSLGNANSLLTIGNAGTGSLTVSNGATVQALMSRGYEHFPAVAISNSTFGGTSSLTVTGAGSSFQAGSDLLVGATGLGALAVTNGGSVTTPGFLNIGSGSSAKIDGAGSIVTASSAVVGGSTLTISNGGSLQSPNGTIGVGPSSSYPNSGILNVGAAEGSAAVGAGTITAKAIDGYSPGALLNFNHTSTAYTLSANLINDLTVHQNSGTTILTGTSSYTGPTVINGGTLVMNGSVLNSPTTVNAGTSLTGTGMMGGTVTVQNGGTITPGYNTPGTLTVGSLVLNDGSELNYTLNTPGVAGGDNSLLKVNSNLTLDGIINFSRPTDYTPGDYTLFTYGGALVNNGLELGGISPGYTLDLDTATAGQVVLHIGIDNVLYWNGTTTTGLDGTIHGGDGTWASGTTNWTYHDGTVAKAWNNETAVFAGTAGTVTLNGNQSAKQIQFATTGYILTGDSVDLGSTGTTVLVDSGVTATVNSKFTGSGILTKTGDGTLVMGAPDSDYTGGVILNAGTLSISALHNLGNGFEPVTINGGTLAITSTIYLNDKPIVIAGNATIDVAAGQLGYSTATSGTGMLTKEGDGTYQFVANPFTGPRFTGGITLNAGKIDTSQGALSITSLSGQAGTTLEEGSYAMVLNQDSSTTFAGTIQATGMYGNGGVVKNGTGSIKLSGVSTYGGATVINQGSVVLGAANAISSMSQIKLAGGTFDANGFSPAAFTQSLMVNGEGSTLEFGLSHEGGVTLQFANSSGELWTSDLTLLDFTVGTDELVFGTDTTGLTTDQLAEIKLAGYEAIGLNPQGLVQFQVVPEPSVSMLVIVSFAGMMVAYGWRRRASLV